MEDNIVEQVFHYLQNKQYPPNCTNSKKRQIRARSKRFAVREGELHYDTGQGQFVRYIISRKEQERIAKACHIDPTSGHMGVKKTIARIKERFTWKGMYQDVERIVGTCDVCQRVNAKLMTMPAELHPVPVHYPWHHVGIDFVGPISPRSLGGNKYILTLSDYFSKWVEAVPMPNKEAPGIAMSLQNIFLRMGYPKLLTSDRGSEFRNNLDKELMKLLGIRRHYTTAYHPQANGLDERWNQTMKAMLIKYCHQHKDMWDEHLSHCVFAYNTSRHESSQYSPFEVMFGRKAILPIELDYEKGDQLLAAYIEESDEVVDTISDLAKKRQVVLKKVHSNIKEAQEKQKETYNRRHATPYKFELGTKVLKKDFRRKKRRGGKMDPRWLGPFIITKTLAKGFYTLADLEGKVTVADRVHGAHLKVYLSPDDANEDSIPLPLQTVSHDSSPSLLATASHDSSFRLQVTIAEDSIPLLPPPLPALWNPPGILREDAGSILPEGTGSFLPASLWHPPTILVASSQHPPPLSRSIQLHTSDDVSTDNSIPPIPPPLRQSLFQRIHVHTPSEDVSLATVTDSVQPNFSTSPISVKGVAFSSPAHPGGFVPEFAQEEPSPIETISVDAKKVKNTRHENKAQSSIKALAVKRVACTSADAKKEKKERHENKAQSSTKALAFKKRELERVALTPKEGHSVIIDLEKVPTPPDTKDKTWVMNLTDKEEKLLLNGGWLNDKIIQAAQTLIKRAYPTVAGLQQVNLGQTLAFDVVKEEFVQVLHTGSGHWLTISTIGCTEGNVDAFDSMVPALNSQLELQIAAILHSQQKKITVTYRQSQQQDGGADCGLFALAFASVLASGQHPSGIHFKQNEMRCHLYRCFMEEKFFPFPVARRGRDNRHRIRKEFEINLFCTCRMPASFANIIKCSKCHQCTIWTSVLKQRKKKLNKGDGTVLPAHEYS